MPEEQKPRLKLYHASPSRSSIVLWMLEELGEPYAIELLDLKKGEQLKPAYLAINPMAPIVEAYRQVLAAGAPPDGDLLTMSAISTFILLHGGYWYFKRAERKFADVI